MADKLLPCRNCKRNKHYAKVFIGGNRMIYRCPCGYETEPYHNEKQCRDQWNEDSKEKWGDPDSGAKKPIH